MAPSTTPTWPKAFTDADGNAYRVRRAKARDVLAARRATDDDTELGMYLAGLVTSREGAKPGAKGEPEGIGLEAVLEMYAEDMTALLLVVNGLDPTQGSATSSP